MRSFDYSAAWLAKYERNDEVPFASKHFHSRVYVWKRFFTRVRTQGKGEA